LVFGDLKPKEGGWETLPPTLEKKQGKRRKKEEDVEKSNPSGFSA